MAQTKDGAIKLAAAKCGISVPEYTDRLANGLKRCTICGDWKSNSEFGTDASRWDGRAAQCKVCRKAIWRRRRIDGAQRIPRRDGDAVQARARINADVCRGFRPNPNDLHCALCGHKGDDKRHEYHHHLGYDAEHHYDVIPLCTTCHHGEHNGDKN